MIGKNIRHIVLVDLMRFLDVLVILVSALIAHRLRFDFWTPEFEFSVAIGLVAIVYTVSMFLLDGYEYFRPVTFRFGIRRALFASVIAFSFLMCLGYISKVSAEYSRLWAGTWILLTLFSLVALRFAIAKLIITLQFRDRLRSRVCLIHGNSPYTLTMKQNLEANLADSEYKQCSTISIDQLDNAEHSGSLLTQLRQNTPDLTFVILNEEEYSRAHNFMEKLDEISTTMLRLPTSDQLLCQTNNDWRLFKGMPVILLNSHALGSRGWWIKSLSDYIMALIAIFVFSPVLIGVAFAVKLSSPGPILFRQLRHGLNGEEFHVYKFRSMRLHDEKEGHVTQATQGDSRITKVGAFIRKTSLDELPQLFNVLKGEMSMVGPRPHAIQHNDLYREKIEKYAGRHRVKPGITGWAQVNGFRGETDTDEKMEMRVKYDIDYIKRWSIFFDIKILFMTVLFGFVNKNAY